MASRLLILTCVLVAHGCGGLDRASVANRSDFNDIIDRIQYVATGPIPNSLLPDDPTQPYGISGGAFDVDAHGNSNYRIGIQLPPARAGLGPKLSLSYSSARGASYLGPGWALGGLAQISRCGLNAGLDGEAQPVRLSGEDRFCLGGDRLVETPPTFAHGGIEYRTERDRFARIVAYDNNVARSAANWNVIRWEIWTKSGRLQRFGTSAQSRLDDGAGHTRRWLLDSEQDAFGNFWTVEYTKPPHAGWNKVQGEDPEIVPQAIRYTGNSGLGGGPTLPTTSSVIFEYNTAAEARRGFEAGVTFGSSRLLANITVYHESTQLWRYRLGYVDSPTTSRPLLQSVRQCDRTGTCLPPIEMTYTTGAADFAPPIDVSSSVFFPLPNGLPGGGDDEPRLYAGDVSGDGATDLVVLRPTGDYHAVFVAKGTAQGLAAANQSPFLVPQNQRGRFFVELADVNADGRQDLLYYNHTSVGSTPADWTYFRSLGSEFTITDTSFAFGHASTRFEDLNGDAFPDRIHCASSGDLVYSFGNGSGLDASSVLGGFPYNCRLQTTSDTAILNWNFLDLDGDGATELFLVANDGSVKLVDFSTTVSVSDLGVNPAILLQESPTAPLKSRLFADINGDGLRDMIFQRKTNAGTGQVLETRAFPSIGTRFWSGPNGKTFPDEDLFRAHPTDLNQDGRVDFVNLHRGSAGATILVSRDFGGFSSSYESANLPVVPQGVETVWGDFDGNGSDDVIVFAANGATGTAQLYHSTLPRADLLETVREASAVDTVLVEYKPLTDSSVYTRSSPCPASGPAQCIAGSSRWVVSAYQRDAGALSPPRRIEYKYRDAYVDRGGRGWLGFARVERLDPLLRTTRVSEFDFTTYDPAHRRFPFAESPSKTEIRTYVTAPSNKPDMFVERIDTTHEYQVDGDRYWVYPRVVRKRRYLPNASTFDRFGADPISEARTEVTAIDDFGLATEVVRTTPMGDTLEISRVAPNDVINWRLGKVTSETRTSTTPAGVSAVRQVEWDWDPISGALTAQRDRVGAAGAGPGELSTTFVHDHYGNVTDLIRSDGVETRSHSWFFDEPQRQFATRETNAANHTWTRTYAPQHGGLRREIDPNGLVSLFGFDVLGRNTRMVAPDGTGFSAQHRAPIFGTNGYALALDQSGQPPAIVEYDRLGRQVLAVTQDFGARVVVKGWLYDDAGRLRARSVRDSLTASTIAQTSFEYDEVGRRVRTVDPDGAETTFEYGIGLGAVRGDAVRGQSITTVNGRGKRRVSYLDHMVRLEAVDDQLGSRTTFAYGPFDTRTVTTDAHGNTIEAVFDDTGFQTELHDPDLGALVFEYNAFGEVTKQIDPRVETTFDYDVLGRLVDQTNDAGETRTWTFDDAPYGKGRLVSTESASGHQQRFEFHSNGHLAAQVHELDGEEYRFEYTYDAAGRLGTLKYPPARDGSRFAVTYEYANGALAAVRDAATDFVFWRRLETDGAGRTTRARFGNGVETISRYTAAGLLESRRVEDPVSAATLSSLSYFHDENRNLVGRIDHRQQMSERFYYDDVDRLGRMWFVPGTEPIEPFEPETPPPGTHAIVPPEIPINLPPGDPTSDSPEENVDIDPAAEMAMPSALSQALDAVKLASSATPNLGDQTTYYPDISFAYDALGNMTYRSDVGEIVFPGTRPDGTPVAHGAGETQPLTGQQPPARQLTYDESGNVIDDGLRAMTYDGNDQLVRVELPSGDGTDYRYSANGQRVAATSPHAETLFLGLYERRRRNPTSGPQLAILSEVLSSHYFVVADGGVVAEVQHQNSPFAVSSELEQELSESGFDLGAVGGTRNVLYLHPDYVGSPLLVTNANSDVVDQRSYNAFGQLRSPDWANGAAPLSTSSREVGYTGHLDEPGLGLVHMGGRAYDPTLARFTSPDPLVQSPAFTQSYNRFAYVFNNPLRFTDPSGFQAEDDPGIQMDEILVKGERPDRTPIVPVEAEPPPPTQFDDLDGLERGALEAEQRFAGEMFVSMIPVIGSYREAKKNEQAALLAKELYLEDIIGYWDFAQIQALALVSAALVGFDIWTIAAAKPSAGLLAANSGGDALMFAMSKSLRKLVSHYRDVFRTRRGAILDHLAQEMGMTRKALVGEYNVYYHGTAVDDIAKWDIDPSRELFTSVQPEVARAFAKVEAGKLGLPASKEAGVAILIPRKRFRQLWDNRGVIKDGPMPDIGGQETVFNGGAVSDAVDSVIPIPDDLWQ